MPSSGKVQPVPPETDRRFDGRFVRADVVDESNAVRHDSAKLAQAPEALAGQRIEHLNGFGAFLGLQQLVKAAAEPLQ